MTTAPQKKIALSKIYTKDVSCESPKGVKILLAPLNKPTVVVNVGGKTERITETAWEVELSITVTLKSDDSPMFLVEIYQGGLFECHGLSNEELHRVLNTDCMEIIFPYARETIDSLAVKSGFPPVALQPVDFSAIYNQALKERELES
jgi:preprotein translocase subunit SecB